MRHHAKNEHGVALITVLLFMVIMFILISTMLAVTRNEAVIAGLHRDGVRAAELAEAGVQEAVRRMETGRDYTPSFQGSLTPQAITVNVVRRITGPAAGYMEIRSDAIAGLARRRISYVVLAKVKSIPPKIFFGYSCSANGNADVTNGDIYCRTYIQYKNYPSPTTISYAGWRIKKTAGGGPPAGPCYTHADCVAIPGTDADRWYAGQRRSAYRSLPFSAVIPQGSESDNRVPGSVLNFTCLVPGPVVGSPLIMNAPGYQNGDERADMAPGGTNPIITRTTPLYGCDNDLMPYTWVREVFVDDATPPLTREMWYKTIIFEDWFNKYWCYVPSALDFQKCGGLQTDPGLGAIPPFPPFDAFTDNYDQTDTCTSPQCTLASSTTLDFGYCANPDTCDDPSSRPRILVLNGNYKITTVSQAQPQPHGVLLVNGNLEFDGNMTYYGTVIVNGTLQVSAGTVNIVGGLVTKSTAQINGTLTVKAGVTVSNVLAGPLDITGAAWWER